MSAKVVSLGGSERLLPYIALEAVIDTGSQAASVKLQTLTPRVMGWDDNIWLLDLRVCQSYWQAQADQMGVNILQFVSRILEHEMPGYRAAMATHPWQAVLLLSQMRGRGLSGLVSCESTFGHNLFQEVPWSLWWECTERISIHFENAGRKRFNAAALKRQCRQMQSAVKRLGLSHPWCLKDASPPAVRRRFGATISDLWHWTYKAEASDQQPNSNMRSLFSDDEEKIFSSGFPWISYQFAEKPRLTRHLDYPLWDWENIQPFLKEDLDRLCALECWHQDQRVVSLEWRVVFHDLSRLEIPINFRHPHSLHLEKGHHKTALLQALYNFQNAVRELQREEYIKTKNKQNDPLPVIPLISWELVVEERLVLPPKILDIFGTQPSGDSALNTGGNTTPLPLQQLENRLQMPLEHFDLSPDWLPEDSFRKPANTGKSSPMMCDEAYRSMLAAASHRPLFIYRKPMYFDAKGNSSAWRFLERTMTKWWSGKTNPGSPNGRPERDYYQLTDREERSLWVYRDNGGKWYVHGIFA